MLKINKGEPWIFWVSNLCSTFPEKPGNKYLIGSEDFEIEISFILLEENDKEKTIFVVLPNYTGVSVFRDYITFTVTDKESAHYNHIPKKIKKNEKYTLTYKNSSSIGSYLFLGDELLYYGLPKIENNSEPHIIFGAANFPKNNFNLNYSYLVLLEFKMTLNDNLISHHKFKKFIFDKSYDLTDNCNFLNKI